MTRDEVMRRGGLGCSRGTLSDEVEDVVDIARRTYRRGPHSFTHALPHSLTHLLTTPNSLVLSRSLHGFAKMKRNDMVYTKARGCRYTIE